MAMTSLNIDFGEVERTANSIKNSAGDFKSLLGDIQNLNDSLKNCWKGADADSYTGKIEEQAQIMNKLQKTIEEIGEYLLSVGKAYAQAMEDNTL